MAELFQTSDRNSLRDKISLLVIDKLIIGALIGLAFFAYDRQKTKDLREYNESREAIQLTFKRAEYIEQLLPIAADNKRDPFFRAHVLATLIDTESIDPSSAVNLAGDIFAADQAGLLTETSGFLLNKLIDVMPAGLPNVIAQFRLNNTKMAQGDRLWQDHARIQAIWRTLVLETIRRHDDFSLTLLDSPVFLSSNFSALSSIIVIEETEAFQWMSRRIKGLRMFGSLATLDLASNALAGNTPPLTRQAVTYLLFLIDPPERSRDQLLLAVDIIKHLIDHGLALPQIGRHLLAMLDRSDIRNAAQLSPLDRGFNATAFAARRQFDLAARYLKESVRYSAVADALLSIVIGNVDRLDRQIAKIDLTKIRDSQAHKADHVSVRVLMMIYFTSTKHGSRAERVLARLFSREQGKLKSTGLWHLAKDWEQRDQNRVRNKWTHEHE